MNSSNNEGITATELVQGVLHLKGTATSFDLAVLMDDWKETQSRIYELAGKLSPTAGTGTASQGLRKEIDLLIKEDAKESVARPSSEEEPHSPQSKPKP